MINSLNPDVGEWFKSNREVYNWPKSSNRKQSEQTIFDLNALTQNAIATENTLALVYALGEIHRWKAGNQFSKTDKYIVALEAFGSRYIESLLSLVKSGVTEELESIIRFLCPKGS